MSNHKVEDQVRSWGFDHVFSWSDPPNAYYAPHSHASLTTHLILKGAMTVWFPEEEDSKQTTYGVGDRVDVDAGRVHGVLIGNEGCSMVIGE